MSDTIVGTKLTPAQAEELRSILSGESAVEFVQHFATRAAAEFDEPIRETATAIYRTQYARNMEFLRSSVESPIENLFFTSFFCSCLKDGILINVDMAPAGDFTKALSERRNYLEGLFMCHSFYKQLPDDARPSSFREFLEITGVECGELRKETADMMTLDATVMLQMSLVHAVHLTLQPTFENFVDGRSVRPDAVLWIPSDDSFRVVIECDGFETHGTKDSFSKDRRRDRIFQSMGYDVRRYSGAEIHHQPIESSFDLSSFLVDQKRTTMTGIAWEKRLLRKTGKPKPEVIDGWRARVAPE